MTGVKLKKGTSRCVRAMAVIGMAIILATTITTASLAAQNSEKTAQMKAGLLYHLAKLVTWNEDRFNNNDSPIIVGFIGDSAEELSNYFKSQAPSYKAQNRRLIVKRFNLPDSSAQPEEIENQLKQISKSHILYIPENKEENVEQFPKLLDTPGMLIVGETRNFTQTHGMVGLNIERKRFVILVNRDNIKHADMSISAQFLQHATIVESKKK